MYNNYTAKVAKSKEHLTMETKKTDAHFKYMLTLHLVLLYNKNGINIINGGAL